MKTCNMARITEAWVELSTMDNENLIAIDIKWLKEGTSLDYDIECD